MPLVRHALAALSCAKQREGVTKGLLERVHDRTVAYACHSKGIVAALHVVVRQNRAAHDGQIGIRANEIVWENLYEVKQLLNANCAI